MAVEHPLHDLAAEQALIGAFLVHPESTVSVARAIVQPLDFADALHQLVVELVYSFDDDGKGISPVSLNAWIKHNPAVKTLNRDIAEQAPPGREGLFYLASLARTAARPEQVAAYSELVLDFSMRRKAMDAMYEAGDLITARDMSVPQPIMPALEGVVRIADEISETQSARKVTTNAGELGDELLHQISHQAAQEQEFGIKTLIRPLDDILGALYPETLIIAGGRPGMGKSVLGENLCRAAVIQGYAADWWSIEMPARECMARLQADEDYDLAIDEGLHAIKYENLVKMRATGGELERAVLANGRLRNYPLSIFSEDRVTMSRIAAVTRARIARNPGPRLIVIDHLHILMPEDRYRGRRVDELSEITGAAKRLAKRTGAVVVLLAQLSRDVEKRDDKHPTMADFRDSGSIEQDADVVLGLYRGEYYANAAIRAAKNDEARTKAIAEYDSCIKRLDIEVLKQRSGQTLTAQCFIDIASSAIRSEAPIPRVTAQLALAGQ